MGRRAGHKERAEETGMILAELAAGLPIIVLFLTFLMVAVLWSRQNYARQIADAELRQEMQIAAARIVESALLSDHIREYMTGVYEMRQKVRRGDQSEQALDRYWLRNGRIVLNYASFPITGSFAGAGVSVSAFSITPDLWNPRLYHIAITGTSTATGRTHRIETSVYLRENMSGY